MTRRAFAWLLSSLAVLPALPAAPDVAFTDRYCSSCHNDVDKDGGLDLTTFKFDPANPENFATWVKVHDRVQNGEMPPKEKKRPAPADVSAFLGGLGNSLAGYERDAAAREGRVTQRRLNRTEYENIVRDLLSAPWLQIQSQLPEDSEAFHFNKVSEALDVSHVHMTRYMAAADGALRLVVRNAFERPATSTKRYYARIDPGLNRLFGKGVDGSPSMDRRTFPVVGLNADPDVRWGRAPYTVGDADPATRDLEAVGWLMGSYEFPTHRFNNFVTPVAGRYRLRFSGYTIWVGPYGYRMETVGAGKTKELINRPRRWHQPNHDDIQPGRRDEPITIYATARAGNRRVGEFDVTPEPQVREFETMLLPGEVMDVDASRFYRSRPTGNYGEYYYTSPFAQKDGAPAVAFRWLEVEGPLDDETTTAGYRLMFGDLPMRKVPPPATAAPTPARGRGGRGPAAAPSAEIEVAPNDAPADAERLLRGFITRAYRRPVEERDVQRFLGLVNKQLGTTGFMNAMIAGYTAVLASPEFVYLQETPGRLDDHALATRLALFLWNSEPDATLRTLADHGQLHEPAVLRRETERLLADPRSHRFAEAFLDYWLELRKMADTTPSTTLYPDYYLDDMLTEAAVTETQMFFQAMLREDLPARTIVDSDFTFANEHLAAHYGLRGVKGIAMRRVALPAHSPRGGLMTQASVLKVTANGTTTSPVIRGKWIMERIVGQDTPPPPAAVPAVEPDIRGAVTIRQQLDKHRADESCATCHRKIDPPGFALESFDVLGGWRTHYRGTANDVEPEKGFGKNGWPYQFYNAQPVDPSGQLLDGRTFADIHAFKRLLLADESQLARNLIRQLAVYATGAPVRFSDRPAIEQILSQTKAGGYGTRSIIHALVQSEMFQTK